MTNSKDHTTVGTLLEAIIKDNGSLEDLGIEVGKLYSDHGLPVDMALDRLELDKEQKIVVLHGVCQWLMEHKRNSGAGEKALERQRNTNRKMLEDFIKTGETGVY